MAKTETKNSRTATGEYYDGGEVETIVYLEGLITALIKNGVEPRRAHNIVAATKIEEALLWLRKRTMGRENRGVEGTHEV